MDRDNKGREFILIHNGVLFRGDMIDVPEADRIARANGHQYVERFISEEKNGVCLHVEKGGKIGRRDLLDLAPDMQKIGKETVNNRMDEIYGSISDTLDELSVSKKYQTMTGPEALRTCAALLRRAPKDAKAAGC